MVLGGDSSSLVKLPPPPSVGSPGTATYHSMHPPPPLPLPLPCVLLWMHQQINQNEVRVVAS